VCAALVALPCALAAQQVAPGDTLHIRLLDRLASGHHASPHVRALVIAPVPSAARDRGRVVIPPGSIVSGQVTGAGIEHLGGKRHWIALQLDSIAIPIDNAAGDTIRAAISVRIASVDDTREDVDSAGRIVGPPIPSMVRSKRDWAVLILGIFHPVGAIILAATLEGEMAERHRAVSLNSGTELTAVIARGAALSAWSQWAPPPPIAGGVNPDSLALAAPLRTLLREGGAPSDVVTLALIGSAAQVSAAFAAAGWTRAVPLTLRSDFVTFVKAARGKGYAAQPVSQLVLDGRQPDVVYEKVADTFAKRHHLRMWRWPSADTADDSSTVWLVAATHDIGVMFSMQRRSFTHRVDSRIDDERDKVVSDLVAANAVAAMSYAQRVAPASGATVNGAKVPAVTDWRMAVLVLK
jgi:LssY C-terminus